MGLESLGEVRYESGYFLRGPEWVGNLPEVLDWTEDGLGDPRAGSGRVSRHLWRSGTGRGTLGEVQHGSRDPRVGLGQAG